MRKHRFQRFMAVTALAALLTGGSTVPVSAASGTPVTLRVWFSSFEAENDALREVAADFTRETGVNVEVYSSNFFDILTRFPNAAETTERPDIVFMQSTDAGSLIESGYLMPADFLPGDVQERFDEVAIQGFSYGGSQYGLGYSVDTYGLLYNKALISAPPETWEELYRMAEDLTIRENGQIVQRGLLLNLTNLWFTYPLLKESGGYYLGQNAQGQYDPGDIGLNSPGMIQGLQKLQQLQEKGMALDNSNQSDSHVVSQFAKGTVAMTFYGLWSAALFQENGIDYGLAPLPKSADGTQSQALSTVQGFVINQFTQHPAEAQRFFTYIFEDRNQQRLYEAANGGEKKSGVRNTCCRAVAQSEYVRSSEILSSQYLVGTQSEVFPNNPEGPLLWNYSQTVMSGIFYGDGTSVDLQARMDEFQAKVEADIAAMRQDLAPSGSDSLFYTIVLTAAGVLILAYSLFAVRKYRRRTAQGGPRVNGRLTAVALLVLVPFFAMLGLFYLYPILDNIQLSMTNYSSLHLRDYSFVGLEHYRTIFSTGLTGFASMLLWTVVFALSVVGLSFLMGALLAVLLDRQNVRVAKVYRVIFILPWAVPSVITLLMWRGLLETGDGLVNNLLGLVGIGPIPFLTDPLMARISAIFVMSWFSFPYYLTVSQGIISNIPHEYYEAMYIDGGSAVTGFFRITLPTVVRSIVPALLMGFIMQFNQFGVYLLTGGGPTGDTLGSPGATDLLITYVFNTAFNTNRYGLAAAYAVLIFLFVGSFALLTMWMTKPKNTESGRT